MPASASFAHDLLTWGRHSGRQGLPWQAKTEGQTSPYWVWLSEVMLQQTQLATMLAYYQRFLQAFPDLNALAQADTQAVLGQWSGLGYYARARNLHRAAQTLYAQGARGLGLGADRAGWPQTADDWLALPGIGRSTAAAICAVCFEQRVAILDGNVKRVLARLHCAEQPWSSPALSQALWPLAEALLPDSPHDMPLYTQSIMDLGATVCTARRPDCARCPVQAHCQAHGQGRVTSFPVPSAKAQRPTRQTRWLVIRQAKAVWLLSRPPAGLWGGLLCLPEWTAPNWPSGLQPFVRFRHSFTHFHLEIEAAEWLGPEALAWAQAQSDGRWLPMDQLTEAALPTPVRRVLAQSEALPAVMTGSDDH